MIGLFNDSFPPVLDGVTLAVQNYVNYLVKKGQEVTVVTPWNPVAPSHEDFGMKRYFSLPIYNRRPYRYGYPWFDPWIWHDMRKLPFKLVHAHCPFSSGRLAAYAARYHNVPLITTFHSKYRTDLERSLPPFMVKYQMKRLLNFYENAYEVWIPQPSVEETLREYGYTGKVVVVENGNDLGQGIEDIPQYKLQSRSKLQIPPQRLMLLFVGQHILEKGVEVIIRAISLLDKDKDVEMNFIGTGYASGDMKRLVKKLGLEDKIHFNGVVKDREQLREYYAASDLFLFPSFYDNAPLVVREAAAMQTPSLLLNGSTAAEMVTDGKNAFLTQRTSEAYASLIDHLYHNRELIKEVGKNAQTLLSRSWEDVMDEVQGRYEEILKRWNLKMG